MNPQPQNDHPSVGGAKSMMPYEALDLALNFENQDQHNWWKRAAPVLGQLMLHSNYNVNKQYQYLAFFAQHIIPLLGPVPDISGSNQRGLLPLEISQNFQESGNTVRLLFEPKSYSGYVSTKDPFGELLTHETLSKLGQVGGVELDLQLYYQLASLLNLSKKEEREIIESSYDSLAPTFKVQSLIGLQLPRNGNITLKVDWFLSAKSMITKTPISEITFEAIRKLDQGSDLFIPALRPIEEYFKTIQMHPASPSSPQTTEFCVLACHLANKSQTRLKLYFSECLWKFSRLSDLYTLGGRLNDCPGITQGLEILHELWSVLQISEGYHYPSLLNSQIRKGGENDIFSDASRVAPEAQFFDDQLLVFNFEIRPGDKWPQPKVYFPLSYLTDSRIMDAVVALFNKLGWKEEANRYKENFKSYYPMCDFDKTSGLQHFLSFSYNPKTGPYTSVYYWKIGG
ncbi:Verruculogen prenyltransferase [Aspergillus granulosus]|uniref:Verruculogen prenyltransferase n=1 Tax=Aspergillus granulosus TaxID=176169 RepID=A0ABR4HMH4_9EURO